ncbi:hypothetical protein BJ166DRAFT_576135 [Pestalotiopsis sp. NC0098]|nr:hypothetical protein BJ166DRAFT_576135 [Pestalotiopsis sp. NC0098]
MVSSNPRANYFPGLVGPFPGTFLALDLIGSTAQCPLPANSSLLLSHQASLAFASVTHTERTSNHNPSNACLEAQSIARVAAPRQLGLDWHNGREAGFQHSTTQLSSSSQPHRPSIAPHSLANSSLVSMFYASAGSILALAHRNWGNSLGRHGDLQHSLDDSCRENGRFGKQVARQAGQWALQRGFEHSQVVVPSSWRRVSRP